jgi:hypothetical protein
MRAPSRLSPALISPQAVFGMYFAIRIAQAFPVMAHHGPSGSAQVLALPTVGSEAPRSLRIPIAVREPRPTKNQPPTIQRTSSSEFVA